jgi:hypothetical protein
MGPKSFGDSAMYSLNPTYTNYVCLTWIELDKSEHHFHVHVVAFGKSAVLRALIYGGFPVFSWISLLFHRVDGCMDLTISAQETFWRSRILPVFTSPLFV